MRILPTTPTAPHATTAGAAPTAGTSPATPGFAAHPARWAGADILTDPATARVLHAVWSGDPAVVVPSPPGAGKTRLVALLGAALSERAQLRVGIAAQTRDQAAEIARRVGALTDTAVLMWASAGPLPDSGATPTRRGAAVRYPGSGGGILIGTTARWLVSKPDAVAADVIICDESWQCTYADLGALGAHAGQIVCVGDPGQIDPVVTGDTTRWRNSPTGPHLPAPDALLAAHGDAVGVVTLLRTYRLGPDTTALVQPAFYPDLPFTSARPPEHLSTTAGGVLPEMAHRLVQVTAGPSDPALIAACADRVRTLLDTTLTTPEGHRVVTADDLAVVCSHVTQAAAVRATLADLPDLLVGTANQLQGLERHAVVVLHPLAGYRDTAGFATDTGRACVMLSRHRTHLTVVLDAATPAVLDAADPTDPGVRTHRRVLTALLDTAAV